MLSVEQYERLQQSLAGAISMDGKEQTITNLYYDTADFGLVRASIEKPLYKEKLRLRAYGRVTHDTPVFLELKKKYSGIVYKRREKLSQEDAAAFLGGREIDQDTQILREIGFLLQRCELLPKVCLCYERRAFFAVGDPDLRLTFDTGIRYRDKDVLLSQGSWGREILRGGEILMEVKAEGGLPIWLSHLLSELNIFPSNFSKYGYCYQSYIQKDLVRAWEVAHSA